MVVTRLPPQGLAVAWPPFYSSTRGRSLCPRAFALAAPLSGMLLPWLFPHWLLPSFSKWCSHGLSWERLRKGRTGLGKSVPSATWSWGKNGPHGRCRVGVWSPELGAVTRACTGDRLLGRFASFSVTISGVPFTTLLSMWREGVPAPPLIFKTLPG